MSQFAIKKTLQSVQPYTQPENIMKSSKNTKIENLARPILESLITECNARGPNRENHWRDIYGPLFQ